MLLCQHARFRCLPLLKSNITICSFTGHVAIARSKCVPSGIFHKVQQPCQVSIALLHYWHRYSEFCVSPPYLHNRGRHKWLISISLEQKKISQREKMSSYSTLKNLLNERNFQMTYFSGHMHYKYVIKYDITVRIALLCLNVDFDWFWHICLIMCSIISYYFYVVIKTARTQLRCVSLNVHKTVRC